jgi:hypothetical protein
MLKNRITSRIAGLMLALAMIIVTAAPAAAAAISPGACNMFHVSATGMAGMLKASDRGLGNMMALVTASEESGCPL